MSQKFDSTAPNTSHFNCLHHLILAGYIRCCAMLAFILLPVGQVAGEISIRAVHNGWTIYADIAIEEGNTPQIVVILPGGGTVEVIWFYGVFKSDYIHGGPLPADNTLMKTDTRTEPDFWEEDNAYHVSNLVGSVLQGDHTIWASVQLPEQHENLSFEIQVEQDPPPPPPIRMGWADTWPVQQPDDGIPSQPEHYIKWNKIFSSYIRGTDFSQGYAYPYLNVYFPGPWIISFYEGEVGDTSNLIYSATQAEASQLGGTVWFNNYVVSETTQVWARLDNGESQLDSNPVRFNVIDPALVELVDWPDTIKDADVGSQVTFTPEFNIDVYGSMQAWIYQGLSGDTSRQIAIISANSIPELKLTVPSFPTYYWARIQYGDLIIDTPSTLVSPLPVEAPAIVDQPNDLHIPVGWAHTVLYNRRVGVTGGQLNFQWYEGLPGDLTKPLGSRFSPINEGNVRAMDVDKPASSDTIYVRVSNSHGTVDSRAVKVGTYGFEDTMLLNYPLRVRLRQQDLLQSEITNEYFDMFWCEHWLAHSHVKLMKEQDGTFVDVHTNSFAGGFPFYFNFRESNKRVIAASLPSGTYKYRVFSGEQFYDSEPFLFINECLDTSPLEVVPAAYPMAPAGLYSDGGIFTAKVYLTRFIDASTMRVYAGPMGDRSTPVKFESDHSTLYNQLYKGMNFGQYVLTINWPSTGRDMYWFEALTHDGDLVRSVLRYPQLGSASSSGNGHVTNVLLPPGSDVIPIPNLDTLPDIDAWRFGEQDGQGTRVRLPLRLADLNRASTDVTLWNDRDLPVERVALQIDPNAPPQFLDESDKAAVMPSGRVLWTSHINGDVNRTIATSMNASGDSTPVVDSTFKMAQGFMVPADAVQLKVAYMMDDNASERIYTLSRLDADFLVFAEVSRTEGNTLVTERMGTFLEAQEYPQLRHAELGWMYVFPLAGGVLFYGDTAPGRTDWNWMHPDYFPLIYNFGTGQWLYFWVNGYGWFWDYDQQTWYIAGAQQ